MHIKYIIVTEIAVARLHTGCFLLSTVLTHVVNLGMFANFRSFVKTQVGSIKLQRGIG